MKTDKKMPKAHSVKWHHIYYFLAAFDLLAICLTLYKSHLHLEQYSKVVQSNASTLKILSHASKVLGLAQKANAPGNDIFDSQDATQERTRYQTANAEYDRGVTELADLLAQEGMDSDRAVSAEQIIHMNHSMAAMRTIAEKIFTHFEKGEASKAGSYMAQMDREYGVLLQAIEAIRTRQVETQAALLSRHESELIGSKRFEAILSILVLFALTGVALYGSRLSRFVDRNSKQSEELTQAELGIQTLAVRLEEAELLSKIGFWELNLETYQGSWSNGQFAIFGLEPMGVAPSFELFLSYVHPDDRGRVQAKLIEIIENKLRVFDLEFRILIRGTQSVRWLKEHGRLELSAEGKPLKLLGSVQDITQEKLAEIELRGALKNLAETSQILEQTGQMAKVGGWELDLKTGKVHLSKETQRIHGIDHDYVAPLYDTGAQWYPPQAWPAVHAAVESAIKEGKSYDLETPFITAKGQQIWVRVQGFPVMEDGKVIKLQGTFQDITERILSELELKNANLRLIQASKLASLGEMSAGIAHEINNPLAIIAGSIGLLAKFREDPDKIATKIEAIQKSCDRISKIVNGLRKFSRTSDASHFEQHRIADIVSETVTLTEAKSKLHNTLVKIECHTQAYILCNEVEIEQVLINLINNGIDAVQKCSEKWVKVSLRDEGSSVALRVTDSGLGIPENIRDKLFDPFFTTKKVGDGTGLGLSITKGILEGHQASIALLTNEPNTCFEIRFPKVL